MRKATGLAAALALTTSFSVISSAQAASTLESVQERGYLQCGVNTGLPGFSSPDDKGNWQGMDVDTCRAVAAATLGDADKVKFIPLTAKERFTALQSGEIDVLSRNTTWTLTRDSSLGLNFAGVNYYDGQGFLVSKNLGVKSALELDGATVCIQAGTTSELNLADYFRQHKMEYQPVVFDTSDQTISGFEAGRCDMLTSDQSQLYALRIKLKKPDSAMVLPEVISKEPLGPVVRQGDDQWFNIVKWSLFAQLNAEEMGLTSANIDSQKKSDNPAVGRFIGKEGIKGKGLGLADDWAYQIVKQVGNYGEIFERNVGEGSPLKIARGINALWNQGGIQYAPPIR
ncbi:amino acid ABC transporter substrate-binding protein [Endozoicomonadaceae bacterium StTr2]